MYNRPSYQEIICFYDASWIHKVHRFCPKTKSIWKSFQAYRDGLSAYKSNNLNHQSIYQVSESVFMNTTPLFPIIIVPDHYFHFSIHGGRNPFLIQSESRNWFELESNPVSSSVRFKKCGRGCRISLFKRNWWMFN